jgi:glycine cleavage system H protein
MNVPDDRRYLKTHEWHKLEGGLVVIGITQFAADELTDITYASLPTVGKPVTAGKPFGEIESVKATSDLYSGVSGDVAAVNEGLSDAPERVNKDPFGEGWLIKVRPADPSELDRLMTAADYVRMISS